MVRPPNGRQRIQTPHIKAMAAAGMVFETRCAVAEDTLDSKRCSSARICGSAKRSFKCVVQNPIATLECAPYKIFFIFKFSNMWCSRSMRTISKRERRTPPIDAQLTLVDVFCCDSQLLRPDLRTLEVHAHEWEARRPLCGPRQ